MLNKEILMGRLTRDPETKYVNDKPALVGQSPRKTGTPACH